MSMSEARDKLGVCRFQEGWLVMDEFKLWLDKSTCDTEFRCLLCRKSFKLGMRDKLN